MKCCSKCKQDKPFSEFYKRSSTATHSECKTCMRARNTEWQRANPEKVREKERRRRLARPGRSTEYVRRWRRANAEKNKLLNAPSEKRRAADRVRYRETPGRKEAVIAKLKALNKRRPEIKNAITARRRALQKNALVPWADKTKMRAIYAEAKRLERETGLKHHVDHIVPLQSPFVCGLHWEGNLQVLPAVQNQIKGNSIHG